MMKSLIIYAHPWDGSFNHALLEDVKNRLVAKGKTVSVIDLNKDGFNPVMSPSDLRLFSRGEYADPLAKDYVSRLKTANEVIFMFPIWWYGEPAILKGFFDKVLLKGQVYEQADFSVAPLLHITNATIITTASINQEILENELGDPIGRRLISGTLARVGITHVKWLHCGSVHLLESREELKAAVAERFG